MAFSVWLLQAWHPKPDTLKKIGDALEYWILQISLGFWFGALSAADQKIKLSASFAPLRWTKIKETRMEKLFENIKSTVIAGKHLEIEALVKSAIQ